MKRRKGKAKFMAAKPGHAKNQQNRQRTTRQSAKKETLEGINPLREKVHLETKYFLLHVSENVKQVKPGFTNYLLRGLAQKIESI